MSVLSSLISYRPGLKGKVAIKSPFGKRRFDPSTSTSHPFAAPEVIDIADNARRSSLDFCDSGNPSYDSGEPPLLDEALAEQHMKLELDLSPDSEPLSDWFSTSFPRPQSSPKASGSGNGNASQMVNGNVSSLGSQSLISVDGVLEEGIEGAEEEDVDASSSDLIANLKAMDASSFGKLAYDITPSKNPSPIKIPQLKHLNASNLHSREPSLHSHPMSELSSPVSSAVSGTTLARQLIGNGYVLSHDNRYSTRYRTYTGLTRSDSTTLPHDEHGHHDQHFQVGPEAPPIPRNAELRYVPPTTKRSHGLIEQVITLKRRSSTGSLNVSSPDSTTIPISPPIRPSSVLVSPTDSELPFPLIPQRRSASPSPSQSNDGVPSSSSRGQLGKAAIPPAIVLKERIQEQPIVLPDFNSLSPRSSGGDSASANNLEDVLDYYSFSDTPEEANIRAYQPVFTPITEESMSQLSPPIPYWGERRESQRSQPIGARNPVNVGSFRGRAAFMPPRRPSDGGSSPRDSLPSQDDRPLSVQLGSSPTSLTSPHPSNSSTSSVNSDMNGPLLPPPPLSKIFNRQRSGSAPSPIKVVRDANDLSSYNITVAAQHDSTETTPTTGDSDVAQQTFPETPNAFSPVWTSGSVVSPGMVRTSIERTIAPMSSIPLSASLPTRNSPQHSLAQQILLTRSATSIRGARHSRQPSGGRGRGYVYGPPSSPLSNRRMGEHSEPLLEEVEDTSDSSVTITREGKEIPPPRHPPPLRSLPPSPIVAKRSSQGQSSTSSQEHSTPLSSASKSSEVHSSPMMQDDISRSSSNISSMDRSLDNVSVLTRGSSESPGSRKKALPPIPFPPAASLASTTSQVVKPARGRIPPALQFFGDSNPNITHVLTAEPETFLTSQNSDPAPSAVPEQAVEESRQAPTESQAMPLQSSNSQKSANVIDDVFRASTNLGSPPPYYSVVDEAQSQTSPPQTDHSAHGTYMFGPHPLSVAPSQNSWTLGNDQNLQRDSTSTNSKSRARPPLPSGPRKPSLQVASSGSPAYTRDRSGSVTSVGSSSKRVSRRAQSSPLLSPKFQAPPAKWRGYTMEAAKWTFTSSQLQAVVSRAIKQSAEASSIRLLKLESLEVEIPEEMHRLEMQRTDVKHKYKAMTRRRAGLFESLSYLSRASEESSTFATRLTDELKEISTVLDKLAEELHSTDQQLAQLDSLCQVHSASALQMALRKLNSSFLKQVSDNQMLREQIIILEAERDEAWKQAEEVASEYDHLNINEKVDSPMSKRSSRISAKRKSSLRVSKAGLRSRRQSQRSSIASSPHGFSSTPSGSKSPFRMDKMPPVPPIPKRRPIGIITDYHSPLRSSDPLSTDGITPDSETRAMVQAQEELYYMLGISIPDSRLRRSRSVIGLPSASGALFAVQQPLSARLGTTYKRSSLPGESTFAEAHNAIDADRNAVLATFEMIRDEP